MSIDRLPNDIPDRNTSALPSTDPKKTDQLARLIEIALRSSVLFAAPDESTWASIKIGNHWENYPLVSQRFGQWLISSFLKETDRAPRSDLLSQAIQTLDAKARHQGSLNQVFLRTGQSGERLYLDLGDDDWSVVEIDKDGWRTIERSPVFFRRRKGMLALPAPERAGDIHELRQFVNVADERDFQLLIAWLIAALRSAGPYPILILAGEPGSAKSTTARMLRNLVDPNFSALRSAPRDERDCWIIAANSGVMALDNLSNIPVWLSDALCRVSTGGGYTTRQLRSDADEMLIDVVRPIILTAVGDIVTQSDLASRAITIELPTIKDQRRRDEAGLLEAFAQAQPRILGALLDIVVGGLRNKGKPLDVELPRMADFVLWIAACEDGFAANGEVVAALKSNMDEALQNIGDADPIHLAVMQILDERKGYWIGPADELLTLIRTRAAGGSSRWQSWPTSAQALSNRLRMAQPSLRRQGVILNRGKTNGKRYLELKLDRQR